MQLQKHNATEVMALGKAFAESGMFPDIKSAAQAIVKIQAGAELGIGPFQSMSGIHIISGNPTIGAGVMASMVKASGKYNYKVTEQTEKICSIEFFEGKDLIGTSTFTIEDAKKAGTKNLDKFPRNMLFARAMSNGVKWYTPDVFAGPVYVPEEMEQVTQDVPHEVIKGPGNNVYHIESDTWKSTPPPTPSRTTVSDKLFKDALKKVKEGAMLKDGTKSVAAWLVEDVELTEPQVAALTQLLNEGGEDGTN
jgi:hypothetical protein